MRHLKAESSGLIGVNEFESLNGKGVRGVYEDETYWAGSHKILKELQIATPESLQKEIESLQKQAKTLILFYR